MTSAQCSECPSENAFFWCTFFVLTEKMWQEGGVHKQGKCIKFKALVQENTGTQDGFLGDGLALRMPGKQSSQFSALAGRAYSCTAPSQIISTNVFKTSG